MLLLSIVQPLSFVRQPKRIRITTKFINAFTIINNYVIQSVFHFLSKCNSHFKMGYLNSISVSCISNSSYL